jgi:hypothetical protein
MCSPDESIPSLRFASSDFKQGATPLREGEAQKGCLKFLGTQLFSFAVPAGTGVGDGAGAGAGAGAGTDLRRNAGSGRVGTISVNSSSINSSSINSSNAPTDATEPASVLHVEVVASEPVAVRVRCVPS